MKVEKVVIHAFLRIGLAGGILAACGGAVMALLTLMSGSTASDVSALWGWVSLASLAGGAAMAVVFWQALRGNGKPLILFSVLGAPFFAMQSIRLGLDDPSQPYVIVPLAFLIVCTIVGIRHQVEDEESPKGGMSK